MRNPVHVTRLLTQLARLTADLRRLDAVLDINDTLMRMGTEDEVRLVLDEMRRSPAIAEALRTRHHFGPVDLDALATLPESTLGGAYARFMHARGLSPASLPRKEGRDDLDYLLGHFYETHDLWHVLTGFDTDPAGESGLQAFYLAQQRSYLPFFVLSAVLLNTAFFDYDQKDRRLDAIASGWLLGKRAAQLSGIDWRPHLQRPIDEVRKDFRLAPE